MEPFYGKKRIHKFSNYYKNMPHYRYWQLILTPQKIYMLLNIFVMKSDQNLIFPSLIIWKNIFLGKKIAVSTY